MKHQITVTLDLSPNAWRDSGGEGSTDTDVREDLTSYVLTSLQGLPMLDDADATITATAQDPGTPPAAHTPGRPAEASAGDTLDHHQLGDATVLKLRVRGFRTTDTLTIHRARRGAVPFDVVAGDTLARTAIGLDDLPELLRTFISRSGRKDLVLTVAEPQYETPAPDPNSENTPTGTTGEDAKEEPDGT
ncbi:hypothetical protein ACFVWN_20405 [Nocardiopsis flavescens]|uniref:hypothetical protein n=1 Tax=Nocardiopsis flavescens TaxID=758803 RepID=UPI00364F96E9